MESTHCSTAPAIVRHVRAWPRRLRSGLLAAITLAALLTVLSLQPIPQAQAHHNFADQRELLGSGHTLKHLLAGAAAYPVLHMLTARRG